MQMPIKGNEEWLNNLKPGDKLYTSAYESRDNTVITDCFVFDEYDTKSVKNEGSILANLHKDGTKIELRAQQLNYGFFESEEKAIEAFYNQITEIQKAAKKSLKNVRGEN